ncbi:hypothetical protein DYB34_006519 [Aphanomyces astaci]|uniref:WH2 domain-containing protein n=1 Tax=Aphanomyces astaci TaxID=112090 RepID=A0A418C5Z8_APHAT|nr:hypothetical protein DYB34_006519 [Aphanomyces astaci]
MLPVHTADISTPTPGSPTQDGIAVDTVPFCICISTSSGVAYLDVHDDASKKAWSAVLLRIAQNGPQDANFSKQDMASTADFVFSARVSAYRVIDGKAYICNVCDHRDAVAYFQEQVNASLKVIPGYCDFENPFTTPPACTSSKKKPSAPPRPVSTSPAEPLDDPSEEDIQPKAASTASPKKPSIWKKKKANKGHLRGPEGVTDDPQGTGQTSRCHDDVSKAPSAMSSSCPPPSRGNLLVQIHQGTTLKCVVQT